MMYTYKKISSDGPGVIRSDGVFLYPGDTADWREYMARVFAGYQPEEADPVPTPPRLIPKMQIVERLTDQEAYKVDAARQQWSAKDRLTWEAAGEYVRADNPLLVSFLDAVIGEARRREVLS